MTYKEGDLVKVYGETGEWYGEIVGGKRGWPIGVVLHQPRHSKQMGLAVR